MRPNWFIEYQNGYRTVLYRTEFVLNRILKLIVFVCGIAGVCCLSQTSSRLQTSVTDSEIKIITLFPLRHICSFLRLMKFFY